MQPLEQSVSERMKIARVLCIAMLVFVHVPPDMPTHSAIADLTAFEWLWLYIREGYARASVPLLSIVSGVLLVHSLARVASFRDVVGKKVRTLLVPLILWNLIAVLLNLVAGDFDPATMLQWVNRFLAFTAPPAIAPLYFLRDVFLITILYPVYRGVLRRRPIQVLSVLFLLRLTDILSLVFITPGIPVFFMFGVAVAQGAFKQVRLPTPWLVIVVHVLLSFVITVWVACMLDPAIHIPAAHWISNMLRFMQRASSCLFLWTIAQLVWRSQWRPRIISLEPMAFFYFCGHALVLNIVWRAITLLHPSSFGSALHVTLFLLSPVIAAALLFPAAWLGNRVAPHVMKLLCGGRVPRLPRLVPLAT